MGFAASVVERAQTELRSNDFDTVVRWLLPNADTSASTESHDLSLALKMSLEVADGDSNDASNAAALQKSELEAKAKAAAEAAKKATAARAALIATLKSGREETIGQLAHFKDTHCRYQGAYLLPSSPHEQAHGVYLPTGSHPY